MLIVGLGNPGEEYNGTRHNAGRDVVLALGKKYDAEWAFDKKLQGQVADIKIGKIKTKLLLPDTYMNKSGSSVGYLVKTKKAAADMVVVHDDLDLAIGRYKISFNKSSGGHKGVESIIRSVKTQEFVRIRIGITPATAKGKLKKPDHEEIMDSFIVASFKKAEAEGVKKLNKKIIEALEVLAEKGKDVAMSQCNG